MTVLKRAVLFSDDRDAERSKSNVIDIAEGVKTACIAEIAATMTSDLEIPAAVVLRNVIKNTPTTFDEIETMFGKRVAVLAASNIGDCSTEALIMETSKNREDAAISAARSMSLDEKIIILAEKLHEISSLHKSRLKICADDIDGIDFTRVDWLPQGHKDKQALERHYRAVAVCLAELSGHVAYQKYCRYIDAVFAG